MIIKKCREFSIPLILGVIIALVWANLDYESYHHYTHYEEILGINFHFFVNDLFMVFFFAIAGVEIVNSLLPGGALNPIKKAVAPLMATAGGVFGPIMVFFMLNAVMGAPEYINGWGITTATDIALAWLIARIVFGKGHPAVSFLLLLAVADDAVGLAIIAIFYPDPTSPVQPIWLLLVLLSMGIAYMMNKHNVFSYWPYIIICGTISWIGMHQSHLHPALSLIFIIPFLPHRPIQRREDYKDLPETFHDDFSAEHHNTTLNNFEHQISPYVDFGLILFGLSNAGVQFAGISNLTWIILLSLVVGKTVGVSLFAFVATALGFKLPEGMTKKDVVVAGVIAGMGLTVALFVAGVAYASPDIQGAAKMGALFTAGVSVVAIILGKAVKIKKIN